MAFTRDLSGLSGGGIKIDTASLRGVLMALEKLPKELQRSAEKAVIRAGSKPLLQAAKQRVPVDTGNLKKSLGVTVRTAKGGWVTAKIGPRSGFKSKRGSLTGRRRDKGKEKAIEAQEVAFYVETGTPRRPATPFIRPAIESSQGEVVAAMERGLSTHLTKVAARLASKK
jgi:HK97 gp10 family phage protein